MRWMLLVTIASLTLVCSAFTQTTTIQRRPGRGQARNGPASLKESLGLTDAQVTTIKSLVKGSSPSSRRLESTSNKNGRPTMPC